MIIATAGHVDHGKTSLVRALTGVDTDRLPEEKRRGLTIDLGFAYTDLADGIRTGFVDVPGHHRFITNMVAGVTGIARVLFVVAADDGVMPQTKEHAAILDLLGINKGVVAITKSDKVEPERLEDVNAEITALLRGSSLENLPFIATSTTTGQGIEALKDNLATFKPAIEDDHRSFRLAVDRSFVLDSTGVILSGLVLSGKVQVGDNVSVMPGGIPLSVRSLRVQNIEVRSAASGDRCALQISGRRASREVARRGDWLCAPNTGNVSRRIDVRIRLSRTFDAQLRHNMPVHVHIGSADIPGRLALLDRRHLMPGGEAWAQLVLDRETVSVWGDRFILRDQSAQLTVAGGWVVDPLGAVRSRARPERLRELTALALPSPAKALEGLLTTTRGPVDLPVLARRRALKPEVAEAAWARVEAIRIGDLAFEPRQWISWCEGAVVVLETTHREHSDWLGLDTLSVARALRLKAPETRLVLKQLAAEAVIISSFGIHRLYGHQPRLSTADQVAWECVCADLGDAENPAQVVHQIARELAWEPEELRMLFTRLMRQGLLIQISHNRFLLPETMVNLAKAAEAAAIEDADGLSIAGFRFRAKIGRNLAVEFLEFLDRRRLTRRHGTHRLMISSIIEIFNI